MDQTSGRRAFDSRFLIFVFSFVFGTWRTKPTFVVTLVDRIVTFWRFRACNSAPQLTGTFVMKRLRLAHEDVITTVLGIEPELGRHLLVIADHVVGLLFRCSLVPFGGALNVDAVFVGA